MRNELPYYFIGDSFGGSQAWFEERLMNIGGCAAVTACDTSIYLALYRERTGLFPCGLPEIRKETYLCFGDLMKNYLMPRPGGIDHLATFIEGYEKFVHSQGEDRVEMIPYHGEHPLKDAKLAVRRQINSGFPIPFLMMGNVNPELSPFVRHWFLLIGYDEDDHGDHDFYVRAATYGREWWMDFQKLWETGNRVKGGMILISD